MTLPSPALRILTVNFIALLVKLNAHEMHALLSDSGNKTI